MYALRSLGVEAAVAGGAVGGSAGEDVFPRVDLLGTGSALGFLDAMVGLTPAAGGSLALAGAELLFNRSDVDPGGAVHGEWNIAPLSTYWMSCDVAWSVSRSGPALRGRYCSA